MMKKNVTAIIPFHNEKTRILRVLDKLSKIKNLNKIICVDDGSTDATAVLIEKNYPDVSIIRLNKNYGKSEAVAAGIEKVNTEYILLCDADLHGLRSGEFAMAINTILADKKIDMLIMRRTRSIFSTRLTRGDIILSGERILHRKDLVEILKTKPKKYQLEIAINKYMVDKKKNVGWLPSSALSTFKISKVGFPMGLLNELKMLVGMCNYAGIHQYWLQILFFCHNDISCSIK